MIKKFITNGDNYKEALKKLHSQLKSLDMQGYVKYYKQLSSDEWLFEVQEIWKN